MSCRNIYKRALVAPAFVEKINRNGQPVWRKQSILNVNRVDRMRLCDIDVNGRSLPDFHKAMLNKALPGAQLRIVDGSDWITSFPNGVKEYYQNLFLGLTGNCVLLEDFVSDDEDAVFFNDVVQPAFLGACHISGAMPHVMRLILGRRASSPLWYAYPDNCRTLLGSLGVSL